MGVVVDTCGDISAQIEKLEFVDGGLLGIDWWRLDRAGA